MTSLTIIINNGYIHSLHSIAQRYLVTRKRSYNGQCQYLIRFSNVVISDIITYCTHTTFWTINSLKHNRGWSQTLVISCKKTVSKWRYFIANLNILNGVAVIPMSLISISNGIVVPPLGSIRLMVARNDRFCSGTISGALSVTVAPEKNK